jgi:ABC-type dipeptide/oligopeptide/nickel transport system permease component
MLSYVMRRIVRIVPIAFCVVTVLFFLFLLVPGDPALLIAGPMASPEEIAAIRHIIGLDQPVWLQYWDRISGLAVGDFGYSLTFKGSPLPQVLARLPATLWLTAVSIALTIVIGIPAGVLSALARGRFLDSLISVVVVGFLAIPNFCIGLLLIATLSVQLGWLPSFGFGDWRSVIMPAIALAARLIALVARMTRNIMIEELRKDYVRTARAKGLRNHTVVIRHVLRNALIPVVTIIGLQAGYLLGGAIIVERLFSWPGIGDLLINAVGLRDYALIQAITIIFVIGFLLINLATDLIYLAINPRLRHA